MDLAQLLPGKKAWRERAFNEMFPSPAAHSPAVQHVATGWVRRWTLSTAEHTGTLRLCARMQAGMSMHFWLNMGLSLLFPTATMGAPAVAPATSLLGDGGEPTCMLAVSDEVPVPTPAGVCSLAGCCCGQETGLSEGISINLIYCQLTNKQTKSGEPDTVPVKSLLV